jgi:hypothetical protein
VTQSLEFVSLQTLIVLCSVSLDLHQLISPLKHKKLLRFILHSSYPFFLPLLDSSSFHFFLFPSLPSSSPFHLPLLPSTFLNLLPSYFLNIPFLPTSCFSFLFLFSFLSQLCNSERITTLDYTNLPPLKVKKLTHGRCLARTSDQEHYFHPLLCSIGVNSLPLLASGDRIGDPRTDVCYGQVNYDHAIAVLAVGQEWGDATLKVSRNAVRRVVEYLTTKKEMIVDTQSAGLYLLQSLSHACGTIGGWECSVIVTLCLELETQSWKDGPQWGVVCASVGENKAYQICGGERGNSVVEITCGNLPSRIGTRKLAGNARLFFTPCQSNDMVLIMSYGLHQTDYLQEDEFGGLNHDNVLHKLQEKLANNDDISPSVITQTLIDECVFNSGKTDEVPQNSCANSVSCIALRVPSGKEAASSPLEPNVWFLFFILCVLIASFFVLVTRPLSPSNH